MTLKLGYGFQINQVRWNYKQLILKYYIRSKEADTGKKARRFMKEIEELNYLLDKKMSSLEAQKLDVLGEYTNYKVFDMIINNCDWLDFLTLGEDRYILFFTKLPWEYSNEAPKTQKEAKEAIWEIIYPYVAHDFSFEQFAVYEIEDTYNMFNEHDFL